uniref:Uncharacterized protein n=1 Tax=Strigamia maritima TaxID=126957 RepID=T1ILG8_STRMM
MGTVNSCCCGFTLEQGTIGTGVYCLIIALINFSTGIWALKYTHAHRPSYYHYDSDYINYGVCALIFSILGILATIFLLVGVSKKRRGFIMPWIVMYGITLVIGLPTLVFLTLNVSGDISVTIGQAIGFTIMIYLYIVVISYYKTFDQLPVYSTSTPYNQPGFVVQSNVRYYTAGEVGHTNPSFSNTKHPDNLPSHPPAELRFTPEPFTHGSVAYLAKPYANGPSNYPSDPPPYKSSP